MDTLTERKLPPVVFGLEVVSERDIETAMDGFEHDCKEFAGQFYDMERSEPFRINWPDQDRFVESEWRGFAEATHLLYTQKLGDISASDSDKRQIFIAIVRLAQIKQDNERRGIEANIRLQIHKDTQQFVGDKRENRNIVEQFGKRPSMRAALLNATALKH